MIGQNIGQPISAMHLTSRDNNKTRKWIILLTSFGKMTSFASNAIFILIVYDKEKWYWLTFFFNYIANWMYFHILFTELKTNQYLLRYLRFCTPMYIQRQSKLLKSGVSIETSVITPQKNMWLFTFKPQAVLQRIGVPFPCSNSPFTTAMWMWSLHI